MQRKIRSMLAIALLATACTSTFEVSHNYEEFGKNVMESEIQPFVETVIPGELTKDAEDADYEKLRSEALHMAALFGETSKKGSPLFLGYEDDRKAGAKAAQWFTDIATAATARQHPKLVDLYKLKSKICTGCHDAY